MNQIQFGKCPVCQNSVQCIDGKHAKEVGLAPYTDGVIYRKMGNDEVVLKDCATNEESSMEDGIWFKSSVSGGLYRNHKAAGDVECIIVDGVWYDKAF